MTFFSVAEVVPCGRVDPKPPAFWAGFTGFAPAAAMPLTVTLYPTGAFGLYRYRGLKASVANDLAWAPALSMAPNDKHTMHGSQLCINSISPRQGGAWEFVNFMTSPAAVALEVRTRYEHALAKS